MVASLGVGDFSGGFFPEGQINRHGCALIVSLNSAMFLPVGPRSLSVVFNLSDDVRRFCSVILMLSFSVKLVLIFSMLSSDFERALSGAVMSAMCSPKSLI